ncbi:MAG: SusD/RagB family nutrient-binding outer membrane lipoprotein [Cyclobacteriaceae bacterium]|nr:SusD/RagB family nutrient-binding outer membrane lipoprotein [Cyclobacteriaceae bacterium]
MKTLRKILLPILLIGAISCELNKLNDPSQLTPEQGNPDYVLNGIQLSFADFFWDASDFGMQMTRLIHFYGPTYENGYTASSFDNLWIQAYSRVLVNAVRGIPEFESRQLYFHAGMAQVLSAYTLMTLVDYFGAVPYSQAFDPNNFNPAQDDQAEIYAEAIGLLDAAIANFNRDLDSDPGNNSVALPATDLFYNKNGARWITLAKTLKLRAYLQTRLVDTTAKSKIEALVTGGDLIDNGTTHVEDFNFRYSTNNANPDSRHPYFTGDYLNGASYYQSNYLMWVMYVQKGVVDPRIRYYFYRQVSQTTTDVNELFCINVSPPSHYAGFPFCAVGDGYWGRDFGDFSGIPPDNFKRTAFGVYPAGGNFDNSSFQPVNQNMGLRGAGILPILNSAFTDFMRAEAALVFNSTIIGNPRTLLDQGIRKSIAKVISFGAPVAGSSPLVPTTAAINNYVNNVLASYDAATTNDQRLQIIIKEYWIALFGNGIDAFNTYRRTGKPVDLQPTLEPNGGNAYRSFTYPSVYVTRNNTVSQKPDNKVQVFWDTNPPGFID